MADEPVEQVPGEAKEDVRKEFKFIRWDDSGEVAHLTLNRPKQNVMNIGMLREMASAIDSLSTREDVRLILLDASPECEGYFSLGVGAEGRGFLELRGSRIGHLRRQIKQRLLFVAEVRGHHQLARSLAAIAEAEPLAQMLEAALHRKRG